MWDAKDAGVRSDHSQPGDAANHEDGDGEGRHPERRALLVWPVVVRIPTLLLPGRGERLELEHPPKSAMTTPLQSIWPRP
jgi:hypothetical protein